MKRLLIILFILWIWFLTYTYWFNEFSYEKAKWLAQEYIDNSLVWDDNWKTSHPKIAWEGKYFYTDSDSPSYIEFKVSCDTTPDCGFIMVNFDGDDVSIPIASTSWNTPSEILIAQNWGKTEDNKLYYFNPFEQYSENTKNGEVSSIDPKDNIDSSLKQDTKSTEKEKEQKRKDFKKKLKERLDTNKKEVGDYKKTDDFKQKKKELKEKKLTIPNDEVWMKILPFANATAGYVAPTASDKFIASAVSWTTCKWNTPCYDQYTFSYNWGSCYSGCTPTAVWIVYWWYDRMWTYPDLVTWVANYTNDTTVNWMIWSIKTNMGTTCVYNSTSGYYLWSTSSNNYYKAQQYGIDKWYKNTKAVYITGATSTLFNTIKSEIDAGRPIVINNRSVLDWGHSMVAFGYNSTTWMPIARLNMGWWYNVISSTTWVSYNLSNIDYNLNSMYYNWAYQPAINSLITIKISK